MPCVPVCVRNRKASHYKFNNRTIKFHWLLGSNGMCMKKGTKPIKSNKIDQKENYSCKFVDKHKKQRLWSLSNFVAVRILAVFGFSNAGQLFSLLLHAHLHICAYARVRVYACAPVNRAYSINSYAICDDHR